MQDITKEILEEFWSLRDVKIEKILQQKAGRLVCKISSKEGSFVFKSHSMNKTEGAVKTETDIFNFLNEKEFTNIPKLLKTKSSKNYQEFKGKLIYIMEYVEGKTPTDTKETWGKFGEIAAKLHKTSGYFQESDFNIKLEIEELKKIAVQFPFQDEYEKILINLPDFEASTKSLIHTDIGPHNAVQKDNGLIILVDWDNSGLGTTILDLGFPLICSFVTKDLIFEKEKAQAFYSAYFSKNNLTEEEKGLIFDAGILFALIYLPYGDVDKNWEKIKYSISNKKLISSVFLKKEAHSELE